MYSRRWEIKRGIAAYRRAIELRPNFGETYYSLANLKTFRFTEQDVTDMSQRLANESLPVECRVHFALTGQGLRGPEGL